MNNILVTLAWIIIKLMYISTNRVIQMLSLFLPTARQVLFRFCDCNVNPLNQHLPIFLTGKNCSSHHVLALDMMAFRLFIQNFWSMQDKHME